MNQRFKLRRLFLHLIYARLMQLRLVFSSSALKMELIKVVKTKLNASKNVPEIPGAEVMSLTNALSRKSKSDIWPKIGSTFQLAAQK